MSELTEKISRCIRHLDDLIYPPDPADTSTVAKVMKEELEAVVKQLNSAKPAIDIGAVAEEITNQFDDIDDENIKIVTEILSSHCFDIGELVEWIEEQIKNMSGKAYNYDETVSKRELLQEILDHINGLGIRNEK